MARSARQRGEWRFATLSEALRNGSAADVRDLIAALGGIPEEREEPGDPTALIDAAILGRRDIVQVLLQTGSDANELAWNCDDVHDELPFLEQIDPAVLQSGGYSALALAAAYGRDEVVECLRPHTAAALQLEADIIAKARKQFLESLSDKARARFFKKVNRVEGGAAQARKAMRAENSKLARWIVQCWHCKREGYKPSMPAEIDRKGTAAQVRKLFRPLSLEEHACERCHAKLQKARQKAEAEFQRRRADLPPHVKVEVVQPKRRKKRPTQAS